MGKTKKVRGSKQPEVEIKRALDIKPSEPVDKEGHFNESLKEYIRDVRDSDTSYLEYYAD